jgi:hypothetical protein
MATYLRERYGVIGYSHMLCIECIISYHLLNNNLFAKKKKVEMGKIIQRVEIKKGFYFFSYMK